MSAEDMPDLVHSYSVGCRRPDRRNNNFLRPIECKGVRAFRNVPHVDFVPLAKGFEMSAHRVDIHKKYYAAQPGRLPYQAKANHRDRFSGSSWMRLQ
jgi:hypothetical protein